MCSFFDKYHVYLQLIYIQLLSDEQYFPYKRYWSFNMKKRYIAFLAVFFLSQFYALAQTKSEDSIIIRHSFFDAEPPAYLMQDRKLASEDKHTDRIEENILIESKNDREYLETLPGVGRKVAK